MRKLLILFFMFNGSSSFGQVNIKEPQYYYVSKWQLEELQELPVGSKILFQQNCTTKLPQNVPTGVILFENVFHQKDRFSMAIEFKDTVIASVTYYFKAKQRELLKIIGYSDIQARGSAIKGQWTYILQEEKRRTIIIGDRRKITVVQTI